MLVAVDVAPGRPISRTAREGGRTVDLVITPEARAAVRAPRVLELADWRVHADHVTDGKMVDLSGRGNDLDLIDGGYGAPLQLVHNPSSNYLFSSGWDDMWSDTPAPPALPAASVFEVRWSADLEADLPAIVAPHPNRNFIYHHGSDQADDVSSAVSFNNNTFEVTFWWSTDGETVHSTVLSASHQGAARRSVVVDLDAGTVTLFEQGLDAPRSWYRLPHTSPRWVQVDRATDGPTTPLHDTAAPIRHSSSTYGDLVGSFLAVGWGRIEALHFYADGDLAAGFDVNDITLGPWEIVGGYPPVGETTTASESEFTGTAGETWTIHNFTTGSWPAALIDRTIVLFGNEAYGQTPADDEVFDLDAGEHLTVAILWRTTRLEPLGAQLWSRKVSNPGHTKPGVDVLVTSTVPPGGPSTFVSDNVDLATSTATALPGYQALFTVSIIDRHTGMVTTSINGTPGTPVSLAAIGSLSAPGVPLRVAAFIGSATEIYGSFELISMAWFHDRRLTPAERNHLRSEMDT